MPTKNFKQAAARISYLIGTKENGDIIKKSKTYQNIAEDASAADLHGGLEALASLSAYEVLEMNYIETSLIHE